MVPEGVQKTRHEANHDLNKVTAGARIQVCPSRIGIKK